MGKKGNLLLCILIFSMYLINQGIKGKTTSIFLKCYFNDVLCGILVLAIYNCLMECINSFVRIEKIRYIIPAMLFCGIVWEYVLPLFRKDTTSDILDIIAYIFGGILYAIIVFVYKSTYRCKKEKAVTKEA